MEQYDPQNFESVILYMRRKFGVDIFQEPRRMYAIFCDLSPHLKPYGNIMRQLAERGTLAELEVASRDAETLWDRAAMKARHTLENELFIGAERVDYFLSVLSALCGVSETAHPIPAFYREEPSVKPSPPPAKIISRGECGQNVDYTLDENGVLTISGMGPIQNFEWNSETKTSDTPWRDERETISRVEIQDGVTDIGNWAFHDCVKLTSVTIPGSVTSVEDWAFAHCAVLTSVILPDSVTSIGNSAFNSCAKLTSITIPDSVTNIKGFAFAHCTGLTSVAIPDSVTSIGQWAFEGCTRLTSVIISDSVSNIGTGAFKGCDKLTSVSVPVKTKIESDAFPQTVRVERRA